MIGLNLKATWNSSNKEDINSSGVATFKTSDKEYFIPFNNFTDFYNMMEVIQENDKLSKIKTFESLKTKLNILIQEIEYIDY